MQLSDDMVIMIASVLVFIGACLSIYDMSTKTDERVRKIIKNIREKGGDENWSKSDDMK